MLEWSPDVEGLSEAGLDAGAEEASGLAAEVPDKLTMLPI